MSECRVCGWRPVSCRGRCESCRLYLLRHGRDRTVDEVQVNWQWHVDRALGITAGRATG